MSNANNSFTSVVNHTCKLSNLSVSDLSVSNLNSSSFGHITQPHKQQNQR